MTTTQAVPDAGRLSDLVARDVTATRPNQRSLSDFTYVATWRGFVSVAFVIDVFARRIVGRRASASLRTDLARDALEQAVYDRCAADPGDRVHHSDAARSPSRFARLSDSPTPASNCPSVAAATRMTMPSPSR